MHYECQPASVYIYIVTCSILSLVQGFLTDEAALQVLDYIVSDWLFASLDFVCGSEKQFETLRRLLGSLGR